jgi:hypothetical protein
MWDEFLKSRYPELSPQIEKRERCTAPRDEEERAFAAAYKPTIKALRQSFPGTPS